MIALDKNKVDIGHTSQMRDVKVYDDSGETKLIPTILDNMDNVL